MGRRPEAAEKEVDIKLYATCRRLPDLPSSTNTDSRAAMGGLSRAGAPADQHQNPGAERRSGALLAMPGVRLVGRYASCRRRSWARCERDSVAPARRRTQCIRVGLRMSGVS